MVTQSRNRHTTVAGKQAEVRANPMRMAAQKRERSQGLENIVELLKQHELNWPRSILLLSNNICFFFLNLQEEINPLRFLCVLEIGDVIDGEGEKVLHHDGTCRGYAIWKGLSIFVLSNSLLSWQLLYLASLKLFLCHCVTNLMCPEIINWGVCIWFFHTDFKYWWGTIYSHFILHSGLFKCQMYEKAIY